MAVLKKHIPILLILLTGLILRLWNAGSMSLNNDELSALYRLQYDNLFQLWMEGVRLDGHPAFVQTLLYLWLKIVPSTPLMIRLPGILAGTASIWLVYLLGKKWFGELPGLLAAVVMACMEYSILYNQLARPYTYGLCFTLWLAWAWQYIVFEKATIRWYHIASATIAAACCMYTHYFSFLQALLIGITGLFIIPRKRLSMYLLVIGLAIILFLPHLRITLFQLGVGGVGGWLGKPDYDFLIRYVYYIFNDSPVVITIVSLLITLSIWAAYNPGKENIRFRWITLLWFLLPFLIGFYYSRKVNPVLQFSVLIFGYPFLLLFLFSFTRNIPKQLKYYAVVLLAFVSIATTVLPFGKQYYGRYHFGEYKKLADDMVTWKEQYGNDIHEMLLVNHPFYIRYYLNQSEKPDAVDRFYHDIPNHFISFKNYLDTLNTDYIAYGWTNQYSPPEIHEMLYDKYPYRIHKNSYFNAGSFLFSSHYSDGESMEPTSLFYKRLTYDNFDFDTIKGEGPLPLLEEFYTIYDGRISNLAEQKHHIVHARASVFTKTPDCDLQLVLSIERDGKSIFWTSRFYREQANRHNNYNLIYLSQRLDAKEIDLEKDKLKIYIWNPQKCEYYLADTRLRVAEGNPILYGYP